MKDKREQKHKLGAISGDQERENGGFSSADDVVKVHMLSTPLRIFLLKMESTGVGKHVKGRKGEQNP